MQEGQVLESTERVVVEYGESVAVQPETLEGVQTIPHTRLDTGDFVATQVEGDALVHELKRSPGNRLYGVFPQLHLHGVGEHVLWDILQVPRRYVSLKNATENYKYHSKFSTPMQRMTDP